MTKNFFCYKIFWILFVKYKKGYRFQINVMYLLIPILNRYLFEQTPFHQQFFSF